MQSLINWTYGYQPYSDGEYLVLVKTPSGGTRISTDCYIPGNGWETYTDYAIEAYCSFDDIKNVSCAYLFDNDSHPVNNKTPEWKLKLFSIFSTQSLDEIKNEIYG